MIASTTLQVPQFDRQSVRHAIRFYKKMSYHRSVVLEGVRRCAMRNRHYWYETMEQLTSETDRSPTIGEILDRINVRQAQTAQEEFGELSGCRTKPSSPYMSYTKDRIMAKVDITRVRTH